MTQQMPLPLTISGCSKSRLVLLSWFLPFWYLLTRVVPDKFQKNSETIVCVFVTDLLIVSSFVLTVCSAQVTSKPNDVNRTELLQKALLEYLAHGSENDPSLVVST